MTPPPQRTTGCGSDDVTKPHGVTTGTTAARRSISGLDNSTLRACIARTFDATVDKNTGSCQEHQDFLPYQRQNSSLACGVFAKSKGEMVPAKSQRANVFFSVFSCTELGCRCSFSEKHRENRPQPEDRATDVFVTQSIHGLLSYRLRVMVGHSHTCLEQLGHQLYGTRTHCVICHTC